MYISDGKGMGAYSTVPITKGTTLGEYTGEILSRRDVEARYWGTRKQTKFDRKWRNSRRRRNQGLSGDYLFDMGNDIFIDGEDADVSSIVPAPLYVNSVPTRATSLSARPG